MRVEPATDVGLFMAKGRPKLGGGRLAVVTEDVVDKREPRDTV
jgi:hypothetical protein